MDYQIITYDSYYIYTVYLDKLDCYLKYKTADSFDDLLLQVLDWKTDSSLFVTNAVKNMLVESLFVVNKFTNSPYKSG